MVALGGKPCCVKRSVDASGAGRGWWCPCLCSRDGELFLWGKMMGLPAGICDGRGRFALQVDSALIVSRGVFAVYYGRAEVWGGDGRREGCMDEIWPFGAAWERVGRVCAVSK